MMVTGFVLVVGKLFDVTVTFSEVVNVLTNGFREVLVDLE